MQKWSGDFERALTFLLKNFQMVKLAEIAQPEIHFETRL